MTAPCVSNPTFPWLVAFVRYSPGGNIELVEGAGTLLSRSWVLTAAHAVIDPATTTALIGASSLRSCAIAQMRRVNKPIPAKDYDGKSSIPVNDLALVQLAAPYDASSYVKLGMPDPPALSLGWGDANACKHHYSHDLKRVDVRIGGAPDGTLLGLPVQPRVQTCYGDSGGPLLVKSGGDWVQIGVTSCLNIARDCHSGSLYTALTAADFACIAETTKGEVVAPR